MKLAIPPGRIIGVGFYRREIDSRFSMGCGHGYSGYLCLLSCRHCAAKKCRISFLFKEIRIKA